MFAFALCFLLFLVCQADLTFGQESDTTPDYSSPGALEWESDNPATYLEIGRQFQKFGEYESALDAYDQALAVQPDFFRAGIARGRLLARINRVNEALEGLHAIAVNGKASTEDRSEAWRSIGLIHFRDDQYKEAVDAFQEAISIDSTIAEVHYNLAIVYRALMEWESARKALEKAAAIEPENRKYLRALERAGYEYHGE